MDTTKRLTQPGVDCEGLCCALSFSTSVLICLALTVFSSQPRHMVARTGGRGAGKTRDITIGYEALARVVDGSANVRSRCAHVSLSCLLSHTVLQQVRQNPSYPSPEPIEIRPTQENPSQATLDIHIRPLASLPGTDAKALAATLKWIFAPSLFLSHHPRTLAPSFRSSARPSAVPRAAAGQAVSAADGARASLRASSTPGPLQCSLMPAMCLCAGGVPRGRCREAQGRGRGADSGSGRG